MTVELHTLVGVVAHRAAKLHTLVRIVAHAQTRRWTRATIEVHTLVGIVDYARLWELHTCGGIVA
jgi:hypothetical protein